MSYSITSATWANAEQNAALIVTEEAGTVALSQVDRPQLWAIFQDWVAAGGVPSAYVPPDPGQPNLDARTEAVNRISTVTDGASKLDRAIALAAALSDTIIRKWLMDFKEGVAAAQTLAQIKTVVAGLPDLPDLTLVTIRNAIISEINAGTVD